MLQELVALQNVLKNSSYVIFGFYVNSGPECLSKFSAAFIFGLNL